MKQTRQPVHAVKQSIYLDVYGENLHLMLIVLHLALLGKHFSILEEDVKAGFWQSGS
jgi:hypothetical protein